MFSEIRINIGAIFRNYLCRSLFQLKIKYRFSAKSIWTIECFSLEDLAHMLKSFDYSCFQWEKIGDLG